MRGISGFGVLVILLVQFGVSSAIGCIGNKGEVVDWFVAYKLPIIKSSPNVLIKDGIAFDYFDATNPRWVLSETPINVSSQAVGHTLNQIYRRKKRDNIAYLMYNDGTEDNVEHPKNGHQKGVAAFDDNEGFWLIHSRPKFPPRAEDGYSYPKKKHRPFGQHFLCISLRGSQFSTIAKQLSVSWPYVYDHDIPASSPYAKDTDIMGVVNGHFGSREWSVTTLPTRGGQKFVSFSKSGEWGRELYADGVAPYFKSDLFAETWYGRKSPLPSSCSTTYKVYNVREISLPFSPIFKQTKDHSKWAITSTGGMEWTCIGDINREGSQSRRGGGTVCTDHPALWSAFKNAIARYEHCPTNMEDPENANFEENFRDETLKFEPEKHARGDMIYT